MSNRQPSIYSRGAVSGDPAVSQPLFTDLFDLDELQATQDALAGITRTASAIIDPGGAPITRFSNACRFCLYARRDNPMEMAACMRPPRSGAGKDRGAGPLMYRCPNGLLTACIGMRVEGEHVANWVVGQVADEPLYEGRMPACAREHGANIEQYRAALSDIPVMPGAEFGDVCHTVYVVAGQLAAMAARNLEQTRRADGLRWAKKDLRLQRSCFMELFEGSPQAIAMLDNQDRFVNVNTCFEQLFQYRLDEIKGASLNDIIAPGYLADEAAGFSRVVAEGGIIRRESVRRRKDGSLVDVSILAYPILIDGKQIGNYAIYNDITARKKAEEELRYVSLHDPLTGLYNRTYFEEEMRRLASGRRMPVSIIVGDVDGLKPVNDALGHEQGDQLLRAAAGVISGVFRQKDVVARIGGDEFAVLLPGCPSAVARAACKKIRENIKIYNERNKDLPLGISIGYASGEAAGDMASLYREADSKMYRDKLQRGRGKRSTVITALIKSYETQDFTTDDSVDSLQGLVADLGRGAGLSDARIADLCLLARFYNAMTRDLPYCAAMSHEDAVVELRRYAARFDPELVADFVKIIEEWREGG